MFSTPRRQMVGWVLICVVVTALILTMVGGIAAIRQTQIEGTPTGQKLLKASDRILDCTTPGGESYERSTKRTADAVADINKVAVYAAACADRPGVQGQDEIYSCVIRALAQADRGRKR